VLHLLGAGLSTREIAGELKLSFKTIETHRGEHKAQVGLAERDGANPLRDAMEPAGSGGAGGWSAGDCLNAGGTRMSKIEIRNESE